MKMGSSMFQFLMLMALFTTSCIAQSPTGAPRVSPTATPAPSPVVAPPTPSPSPVVAPPTRSPSPSPAAPTPTRVPAPAPETPSPTPSPRVALPPALEGPPAGPGSTNSPPGRSGTFTDGWVNRAVIAGTTLTGSFLAITLM